MASSNSVQGNKPTDFIKKDTPSLKKTSNTLDREAFLKILMAQLKSQDPMSPMDDKDFVTQMAQFTAIEQQIATTAAISQSQAYNVIGKAVYATVKNPETGLRHEVLGIVDSAGIKDGKAYVAVGDTIINLEDVKQVYDSSAITGDTQTILLASSLVGKTVTANISEDDKTVTQITGVVEKVTIKAGVPYLSVGGKEITLSQVYEVKNAQPE